MPAGVPGTALILKKIRDMAGAFLDERQAGKKSSFWPFDRLTALSGVEGRRPESRVGPRARKCPTSNHDLGVIAPTEL